MSGAALLPRPAGSPARPAATPRSGFVDALRGFALVGICVVNLPFIALPIAAPREAAGGLDAFVQAGLSFLLEGKFFLLFSFLFGFGFAIQLRRIREGRATPASFARRLSGLFAFGALHATLAFPGDILMGYAILGCALWLVRDWPDARLLRMARGLILAAVPVLALVAVAIGSVDPEEARREAHAATQAYATGTFGDAVAQRLVDLAVAGPFIALFNWPLAFAAFCAGLVAGRRDLLADSDRLVGLLAPRAGLLALGAIVGNAAFAAAPWLPGPAAVAGFSLLAIGGPCLSALYVLILARLWRRDGLGRRLLEEAAPAGRMSLTNYLGQSILANVLFLGFGFGLFGRIDQPGLVLIAVAIAITLIAASGWWLRFFVSGPDEWLLRSWTALRRQPFRRVPPRGG